MRSTIARLLVTVGLALTTTAAAAVSPWSSVAADSVSLARQRMITAQTRVDSAAHRVAVRRQRLAAARAAAGRSRVAVAQASQQLEVLLRRVAPAHRRTATAGAKVARVNAVAAAAQRQSADATAALHRMARDAYMNASAANDLAMLLGFASEGPRSLNNLAQRNLAVSRIENRSVLDARFAADAVDAAQVDARSALAGYEAVAAREARLAEDVTRARRQLVAAQLAWRDVRGDVVRLTAAVARAQREQRRARAALRRAAAAYRKAARVAQPGGTTPSAPPISAGNSARYVWDTLRCNDFTEESAAGILGNLQQESNIDPTTIQSGGPGMGLAQWSRGGRWDTGPNSLLAFAAARNLDPWDAATQTRFMIYEMQLGWGDFDLASFKQMTDVVGATIYFHDVYERSADSSGFVSAVRGGYALQWYARLQGSVPAC